MQRLADDPPGLQHVTTVANNCSICFIIFPKGGGGQDVPHINNLVSKTVSRQNESFFFYELCATAP